MGSCLLPSHRRAHIHTFYDFAREIDDIVDTPSLSSDEKYKILDGFVTTLQGGSSNAGFEKAARLRQTLIMTGVTDRHAFDLIKAFRQDVIKCRYESWDELIAYCMLSAAPVGRFLLDLHEVGTEYYEVADALCCALQIINHLQDCAEDYAKLNRAYLPLEWMGDARAELSMLSAQRSSIELRLVLDRILSATDALLEFSHPLAGELQKLGTSRDIKRLAMETAIIQRIASTLAKKLRNEDPLEGRVSLGKLGSFWCGLVGLLTYLTMPGKG